MEFNKSIDFESIIFSYIDEFKFLFSPSKWSSAFLDYSKNELMVLLFLSRFKTANVTEISKYINAPLNTTTGVINRLEAKKMIDRIRSKEDRRIVEIILTDKANKYMNEEKKIIIELVKDIYNELTEKEKTAVLSLIVKAKRILSNKFNNKGEAPKNKKIKKITIE